MSHRANFWLASLDPRRVKAGAFRVLFHLCDHHNDDADASVACYPSQETLMRKTGLSNGALNNALNEMESDGLIARRRATVPGTCERRTYYILGCDIQPTQEQTPENGVSANSSGVEPAKEQTPFQGQANSILGPSKLQPTGEEPVRTGKNQEEPPCVPPSERPPPKARLPSDWALSDEGWAYARSQQIPDKVIEDEARGFHAYWSDRRDREASKSERGWEQCWAGWCRRISGRYAAGGRVARGAAPGGYGRGGSLASVAARRRAEGQV